MKFLDVFFNFLDKIEEKYIDISSFLKNKIKTFTDKFLKPPYVKITNSINDFEVKYLGKGKLKNYVIVKYIFRELFLYFLVSFLFFFMIFFCNQILLMAENILKKRVPFTDVCMLLWYTLPGVVAQTTPDATLVGFLMCLGRLMSDNEILILRASGQGYAIVMIPVFVLGLAISVISFFINDYLMPIGQINYNKLYRKILSSNPGIEIEANSIKRLNNSIIVIGNVEDNVVSDLVFFDKENDGSHRIIVALSSSLVSAKKEGVLMQLNMKDSVVTFLDGKEKNKYDVLKSKDATLNIFESSFFNTNSQTSPREMTSYDLKRFIQNVKEKKSYSKRQLNNLEMEYYKKFAIPFMAVFFAFLAVPLAFLFGKHNGQTIGLLIGVIITFFYWAMSILGQIFASRNGLNSFWAIWYPDFLCGLLALILYVVLKRK